MLEKMALIFAGERSMDQLNLKEKVVLITGGSSGIGFQIAIKYFENDWNVIILGRKNYVKFKWKNCNRNRMWI